MDWRVHIAPCAFLIFFWLWFLTHFLPALSIWCRAGGTLQCFPSTVSGFQGLQSLFWFHFSWELNLIQFTVSPVNHCCSYLLARQKAGLLMKKTVCMV